MLDKKLITDALFQWMKDFVEKPTNQLNNWAPCPFARKARISNQIELIFHDKGSLKDLVQSSLSILDEKEVIVICFDDNQLTATKILDEVEEMNTLLMPQNYVILEDHPALSEFVNGVHMNFGKCGLLVIQHLDKLNQASETIHKNGYYDCWDEVALKEVVAWRIKN